MRNLLVTIRVGSVLACLLVSAVRASAESNGQKVSFVEGTGRIAIIIDGMPVAVYSFQDDEILRPYFSHVSTLDGIQVTRNHPAIEGHDLPDHDSFHPGIWMAFADING